MTQFRRHGYLRYSRKEVVIYPGAMMQSRSRFFTVKNDGRGRSIAGVTRNRNGRRERSLSKASDLLQFLWWESDRSALDRRLPGGRGDLIAQQVGDVEHVALDHMADEHSLDVRIGNVVKVNFAGVILECHLVLDLYDLGCAYLAVDDKASAYKTFVDLYGINNGYRDVVARIEELGH